MTRNICLTIEYDGTRFSGWQVQRVKAGKRVKTIQEEIEKAGKKLFGKKISLLGAGRTDAGVHAEAQKANFKLGTTLPLYNIEKGLNSYLPKDIAVILAEDAGDDFHARFDAKEKLYRYTIINRNTRSPLLNRYAAFVYRELDADAMKKAAKYFVGKKDFRSFQASDKKEKDSVRTVTRCDIVVKPPVIEIYVQADGFLYNMVRNIAGTLIDVGRGRTKPEEIAEILSKKDRTTAGQTAPAKGLCLVKVSY
ncbi:MAG: tRNA pseudouridine(38-40) synthase TruA [Candidatus Omnitrophica bacterium]|nr:tRNA pseudouridine(38-40) synthase TruA [Candidatus Omnitrophota bacterium]